MTLAWTIPLFAWAALTLAAQPDIESARARALLKSGDEHEQAGRLDEAGRDYEAARVAAEGAGNRALVVHASVALGYLQYYRGDTNAALQNLRRGYDLAVALGDAKAQRTALAYIAHVYADARVGQYDRAIEYYRQLLPQYEAAHARESAADTLFNLASTYERKGDFQAALDWYQRALAAEERIPRPQEAAFVKRSIGAALGKLGRPREALAFLGEALRAFVQANDREREMVVRQSRGIVYRQLGRLPEAAADLEATRAWFEQTKNARFLEKTEDELALAHAAAARWKDAFEARSRHASLQRELAEKLREEHTSRLRVQFDTERKEQENRALLRDKAAAERIQRLQGLVLALSATVIAVLVYLALRLVKDARRMRVMALTDELTRLPNRRHLLEAAEQQLQRSRARGEPFCVLALDIDRFKSINDTYGHAAGDQVLQRVAHACRAALRPTDRIGRTGGEEFTVVLPATSEPDAALAAERMRAAVERLDCRDIAPPLRPTISVGVAEWSTGEPFERVAGRADARLYRAKESGRNRVVAA